MIVDSEHVRALTQMRWDELRYRPSLARFGGEEIVVGVRDRELSNTQQAGMEPGWSVQEVSQRTKYCNYAPLVTTCSDGENGGWFRNTPAANFWGCFYQGLLDRVKANQSAGIHPVFIDEYLNMHGSHGEVSVGPGASNTGWHHGTGFVQWTGTTEQRQAPTPLSELSQAIHAARRNAVGVSASDRELYRLVGKLSAGSCEPRPVVISSWAKRGYNAATIALTGRAAFWTRQTRTLAETL